MLQAVLFDMDGVLIDSEPIHKLIFDQYAANLGFALSDEEYRSLIGTSSITQWRLMKERFHLDGDAEFLSEDKMNRYVDYLRNIDKIPPIAGVEPLLAALRSAGVPHALASSNERHIVDASLRAIGLDACFAVNVAGDEVARCKPAPDVYLRAMELLGVAPAHCVAIEDSTNGVAAALAAGAACIGFTNPNSPGQDLAKAHILVDGIDRIDLGMLRELAEKNARGAD